MLNKELLMLETELPTVNVTLKFFGGRNSGTEYSWTYPTGASKTRGFFDERTDITVTFPCKPNTNVSIYTDDYSGDYTATPPQDITVVGDSSRHHLTFTAFRDVEVSF